MALSAQQEAAFTAIEAGVTEVRESVETLIVDVTETVASLKLIVDELKVDDVADATTIAELTAKIGTLEASAVTADRDVIARAQRIAIALGDLDAATDAATGTIGPA